MEPGSALPLLFSRELLEPETTEYLWDVVMGVEWRIYEFANVNIEHVLLTRRLEISGRAIISLCTPLVWLLVRAGRVYFSNEDVYLYSALWGL